MQIELTDQNIGLVRTIIFVSFALPTVPLALGWWALRKKNHGHLPLVALAILSVCYLWVVAVLVGLPVIAPHYTQARDNVINANAISVLVGTLLGIVVPGVRWPCLIGGPLVFVLWAYLGLIGTVA